MCSLVNELEAALRLDFRQHGRKEKRSLLLKVVLATMEVIDEKNHVVVLECAVIQWVSIRMPSKLVEKIVLVQPSSFQTVHAQLRLLLQ